ncbi:hypothetical protein [Actinoplanes sp. G11-F43]|uniref:hypothetical protein n=1 Tax=Actinoplanes sp. G11-F43 TaxID=3424130 RepID=UPI003D3506F0
MTCGVAALLRPGGPVRVPLRECCVAALVGADGVTTTSTCLAAPPDPAMAAGGGADRADSVADVLAAVVGVAARHGEDPW